MELVAFAGEDKILFLLKSMKKIPFFRWKHNFTHFPTLQAACPERNSPEIRNINLVGLSHESFRTENWSEKELMSQSAGLAVHKTYLCVLLITRQRDDTGTWPLATRLLRSPDF